MSKKYLITGGCGFLGSNLAEEVLKRGEELWLFDNLSKEGAEDNLLWLKKKGNLKHVLADIRDGSEVEKIITFEKPDVIFHLAGQVTMTKSIEDPIGDFETNTLGTLNVLEAVRKFSPDSLVIYSSTNKVYGDLEDLHYQEMEKRYVLEDFPFGLNEETPLNFSTPYGCSKGSADQYMLDYHKVFGLNTIVFRHSAMYGSRQYSTIDQGWIGWFCDQALKQSQDKNTPAFTISGNGKQVRDVLHSSDMIRLYFSAIDEQGQIKGKVFNIGGGPENSLSILELLEKLENQLGIKLNYKEIPSRQSDQKVFIADIRRAKQFMKWEPLITSQEGIKSMLEWTSEKMKND